MTPSADMVSEMDLVITKESTEGVSEVVIVVMKMRGVIKSIRLIAIYKIVRGGGGQAEIGNTYKQPGDPDFFLVAYVTVLTV